MVTRLITGLRQIGAARGRAAFAALLPVAVTAVAMPAGAAAFRPPEGCTLEMTVQSRGCTVTQHYSCTAGNPGDQWRVIYDSTGPSYTGLIDNETRWMQSVDNQSGITDRLDQAASADHASLTTLLETGRDDFDFITDSNTGERLRHVGHDELTGETVTIDGVELMVTRFELITSDMSGMVLVRRSGQQYVSREQRRFYGGIEQSADWTGESRETNDSPVTFSFPGEAGFGRTTPDYDCDMQMVRGGPLAPLHAGVSG